MTPLRKRQSEPLSNNEWRNTMYRYSVNRSASSAIVGTLGAGAIGLLAAGCTHQAAPTPAARPSADVGYARQAAQAPVAAEEASICGSLYRVIDQADGDFKDIRLNVAVDPLVNRWDTKPIFPDSDCDVLDWGGGRTTYSCVWPESDQAKARNNYEENIRTARRCLGPDWHSSEQAGKTGKLTVFYKVDDDHGRDRDDIRDHDDRRDDDTKIELRYFQERAPSTMWQTSVTIGDRIIPNTR